MRRPNIGFRLVSDTEFPHGCRCQRCRRELVAGYWLFETRWLGLYCAECGPAVERLHLDAAVEGAPRTAVER